MTKKMKPTKEESDKYGLFIYACEICGRKFFGISDNQVKNNATVHELNCKPGKK
jgi:hypothetical protein